MKLVKPILMLIMALSALGIFTNQNTGRNERPRQTLSGPATQPAPQEDRHAQLQRLREQAREILKRTDELNAIQPQPTR